MDKIELIHFFIITNLSISITGGFTEAGAAQGGGVGEGYQQLNVVGADVGEEMQRGGEFRSHSPGLQESSDIAGKLKLTSYNTLHIFTTTFF